MSQSKGISAGRCIHTLENGITVAALHSLEYGTRLDWILQPSYTRLQVQIPLDVYSFAIQTYTDLRKPFIMTNNKNSMFLLVVLKKLNISVH